MVQLSPFPTLDVTPLPECSDEAKESQEKPVMTGSPKVGLPGGLIAQQLDLESSTAYDGYETYIEDGLICLKHKVRNLEKKKVGRRAGRVNYRLKCWLGGGNPLDFCVLYAHS